MSEQRRVERLVLQGRINDALDSARETGRPPLPRLFDTSSFMEEPSDGAAGHVLEFLRAWLDDVPVDQFPQAAEFVFDAAVLGLVHVPGALRVAEAYVLRAVDVAPSEGLADLLTAIREHPDL